MHNNKMSYISLNKVVNMKLIHLRKEVSFNDVFPNKINSGMKKI